ncbi:hypothetical protein NFI96_026235 [Prochilodus magdalenae]|nr:hypothetical protein NFI96_026235 [Prochilodus magdalenae]
MRVSVVLLWLCLVGVQLLKGDDQLTVEDVQSRLDRLQKESHEETSELNSNEPCADVWAELRDLRDMVVEQRVQLQFSQSLIDELKKENADMNNRLLTSENQVKELKEQNSALEGRVASAEVGMEALRVESANNPKVAFSFASGIPGYLGPLSADIILVFNKEITNIGNAFNPITAGTDINGYTGSITSYISKCTNYTVPKISVRTFPNQKPWINTEVRAKLRARTTAYNTGDLESYKKARHDLQRTIRLAKRNYRDRVESNYRGSDLTRMWNGLRAITDYKDCHGVTQNGSGSSSVTTPALVLVETPNESVCGGTVDSTKMNGVTPRPPIVHHLQELSLDKRVASAELGVDTLRADSTFHILSEVALKVQFFGPVQCDTTLVFHKQITNVGNTYNPGELTFQKLQSHDDQLSVEDNIHSDVWARLRELKNMQSEENQAEGMMQQNAGRPMAAFTYASGLNGYFGPVRRDTTLVFRKRITQVGNAYNPRTGIFTAPVRGLYYFRFNLLGKSNKYRTCVYLFKNNQKIIKSSTPPNLSHEYTLQSPDDQHVVENSVQPDVWTEVKDMVAMLKVRVKSSEMKIKELEQRNAGSPKVAFTFASGLNGYFGPYSSDTRLVFRRTIMNVGNYFNPSTGVFTAPVRGVYYFRFSALGISRSYWTGLQSPDDQLVVENSVQPDVWTELRDTGLVGKTEALEERVASAELGVGTLKEDSTCRPKAAFTFASGLRGYHGPYRSDTRLVFRKKIMNVGYAYNPSTGVFTAPVRGVYYFRFSVLGASRSYWTGVHLVKNHQRIIIAYESPTGNHQYAVGGATLLLEKGDVVYVLLRYLTMRLSVVLIWLGLSSVHLHESSQQLSEEHSFEYKMWTQLKNMILKLKVQVQSSQSQIEALKKQNAALEKRVASAELAVNVLQKETTSRPKVAFLFASGLRGYLGPYSSDTTLIFRQQIMNVGNAFSPVTGVFTAPVRGVYYFRFSVLGASTSYWTGVNLVKNHERILVAVESPTGNHQYATGGATLLLEKGDVVYVVLRATCQICDSNDNHSSFSGFLVYPM